MGEVIGVLGRRHINVHRHFGHIGSLLICLRKDLVLHDPAPLVWGCETIVRGRVSKGWQNNLYHHVKSDAKRFYFIIVDNILSDRISDTLQQEKEGIRRKQDTGNILMARISMRRLFH